MANPDIASDVRGDGPGGGVRAPGTVGVRRRRWWQSARRRARGQSRDHGGGGFRLFEAESDRDIGKFARKFQAKAPECYPPCFGDDPANLAAHYDHGGGGFRLFEAESDRFNLPTGSGVWRPLISAVTGHHGTPPEPRINESLTTLRSDFGRVGIEAAHEFIHQAHGLFAPPQDLPALEDVYLAEQRLVDLRLGKSHTVPLDDVMARDGVDDRA